MSSPKDEPRTRPSPEQPPEGGEHTDVVYRNIRALLAARRAQETRVGIDERIAEAITRFTGSMAFVYLQGALVIAWLLVNLGLVGLRPFDPFPFVMLAMITSVEAIFLSAFVLITQNRMARIADKRAELNLQIDLLAEHEITHLIRMTEFVARKMGIPETELEHVEELKKDVSPEAVLSEIEEAEKDLGAPR